MTQKAIPLTVPPELFALWRGDPSRRITIGAKYRQNPKTCYCAVSCPDCYPGSNARCWQRKTELTFTYRVREHLHTDLVHGLGRYFLVSLVRPDVWQMRAFCMGARDLLDRTPRAKWHTITGIVFEADLGELVA